MKYSLLLPVIFLGAILLLFLLLELLSNVRDRWHFARLSSWKQPPTRTKTRPDQQDIGRLISGLIDLVQSKLSSLDRDELFRSFDRLCDCYNRTDASSRAEIRRSCGGNASLGEHLLAYSRLSSLRFANELSDSENALILERAIASVSIENLNQEWRNSHEVLTKLHKAAGRVGIEPTQYFEEAVEIASAENDHPDIEGHPTVKIFLGDLIKHLAGA